MSGTTGDFELELPNLGDDRAGLDELDDDLELDDPEGEADDEEDADESDDDFDDYPEDAAEEDIDLILALYREEGQPVVAALDLELVNDLDALITQLRRIPGDAGALAMVSLATEVFVLVRVRGKKVQVFLSDAGSAADWPIARDVVDYLGIDAPDEDEDTFPAGDLDILVDAGLPEFELEALASEYDEDSTALLEQIATKTKFGPEFTRAVSRSFD